MKKRSTKLLTLLMLILSTTSCAGLKNAEKKDTTNPEIYKYEQGSFLDVAMWCMGDDAMKLLLKEATRCQN